MLPHTDMTITPDEMDWEAKRICASMHGGASRFVAIRRCGQCSSEANLVDFTHVGRAEAIMWVSKACPQALVLGVLGALAVTKKICTLYTLPQI